ncbi:MAG: peptide ABC transporter substrate-binding protein [Steroidobacteraceae bacterium]
MKRWIVSPPLLLFAFLALSACGGRNADPDRVGGKTADTAAPIKVGSQLAAEQVLSRTLDSAPPALDPSLITDVPAQHILDDLFEGLAVIQLDGHLGPGVAKSWDISADGLIWTFHLRPEARWSNGDALSAPDFVYAWRRLVDPKTGAQYAQALGPVVNALAIADGKLPPEQLGVEAVDAHTLRVHLMAPTPYLLNLVTNAFTFPQHEATVKRWGDEWTRAEHMVSNGPFVLKEHLVGTRITAERNPYYWDAANVKIQRVIFYVVDSRAAQAQRFMAGQVQFIQTFPTPDAPYLKRLLGDQLVVAPQFATFKIGINVTKAPFKDNRALRLALNMGFDRDMITEHVLNGAGFSAYTLTPPLDGYDPPIPDWAKLPREQRHELARRYYREAGYSDKHPLRAEFTFSAGDPVTKLTYEAVVAMWREILGAEITLHEEEFKVLINERRLHIPQLFHDAWIGDYLDPFTFAQLYTTGNELNNSGYSNPEYDRLLDEASRAADNTKRANLFRQAETLLNDDGAYIPIYYYADRHLVKPYLKGWNLNNVDRNYSRYMYLLEHEGN